LGYILLTAYSPEDQAILEAAYARDSKPDKAARLEIVKQVALGEKEVQVSLASPSLLATPLSISSDMVPKPPPELPKKIQTAAAPRVCTVSALAIWRL
jgi:hypothetical protein